MGKLGLGSPVNARRRQLLDMVQRGIVTIGEPAWDEEGELANLDKDVLKWSDYQVTAFYQDKVTESQVDEYETTLQKEKEEKERALTEEEQYLANRPKKTDPDYIDKCLEIYAMGLSAEERNQRIEELQDELRYRQMEYDAEHGRDKEENYLELLALQDKYAVKDYEEQTRTIKEAQRDLEKFTQSMKERFPKAPAKPGRLTTFWNRVQKVFSGNDLPAIKEYDEYSQLDKEKKAIEHKITAAEAVQESIKLKHENIDFDEKTKRSEERLTNLAKDIVNRTMSAEARREGNEKPEIDSQKMEDEVHKIMRSDAFKNVVDKFHVDAHDINPDTFFQQFKKEILKTSQQPNSAVDTKQPAKNKAMEKPELDINKAPDKGQKQIEMVEMGKTL